MGATKENKKPRINRSLISIKVVTFFIISGITALHIVHSTKPLLLGLSFDEYRIVSIIAPFVSILGPLIAGPLADKLAGRNPNSFGRTLRILTAVCLILSCIIYSGLFFLPNVQREEARRPQVSFGCNSGGAVIFQERCSEDSTCHQWKGKMGSVILTNCTYDCQNPSQIENISKPWPIKGTPPPLAYSSESDYNDYDTEKDTTESIRNKREEHVLEVDAIVKQKREIVTPDMTYAEPPHLCILGKSEDGKNFVEKCHVYTEDTESITVHSVLRSATNVENDTHSADWCNYPLDGFECNIPESQAKSLIAFKNSTKCQPMVKCEVLDPYDSPESVLADSQCIRIIGDVDTTVGGYFAIRILGDIFPLAALTLLNTAIVIAVRDTSEGRGEVCRQYVWGAIGYTLLFSPLDLYFFGADSKEDAALVALILVIVCFLIASIVLFTASEMPLNPPEWWWHTKSGMLVYPMSAIRKYGPEMLMLTGIALLFGTFWSTINSYLQWTFFDSCAVTFAGLLLVLGLLFNVDKFVEYCGHSNILIGGFAVFIIRFTALTAEEPGNWLTVLMEVVEPLVLGLIWITIILYMRHIMPRRFTSTGQAIAIIAFFCLGKGFGALIGLVRDHKHPEASQEMFQYLAIASCIIALIYFIVYNLVLSPRCTAKSQPPPPLSITPQTSNGSAQNAQSNGSYTPLRVYHNERGKKGQFRY